MAGYPPEGPPPGYGVGLSSSEMDRSQHYSLRWNNHQSHVLSAFDSLLQNESLVDCTIMCEDSAVRAHRVVLSVCSPYFQKIFIDNPGKHPIIVLKDVRCWEMQCILDFMYKGETSVPEPQLTSLIKAAESLKIRGLTSSDQLPPGVSITNGASPSNMSSNGYRGYSPSPSPHNRYSESGAPMHKLSHMSGDTNSHSNDSSPISLTHQDQLSDRASGRASPVPGSNCPRRKQARPRRRSGDSINSSLDLSKAGSPPLGYAKHESPSSVGEHEAGPQNLSIRREHSPDRHHAPAINLVKMEQLVEDRDHRDRRMEDNISDGSLDRECDSKPHQDSGMDRPALTNGIHHIQEQEALQALNFMAQGGGLPPHPLLPPQMHSPLPGHHLPGSPHGFPGMMPHHKPNGSLPPTSSTPTYSGLSKSRLEYQRISIDRSKLSEDEAFEHAIEMISSRQMGFRKAADFFQVSKWKLYKTARKRGIYAEIKKQNQAHALSKVPSNVQHFAELGVYKQMRKKLPVTPEKDIFPHLPRQTFQMDDDPKIFTNLNNNNNNNNSNNNNNNNNNLHMKHVYDKRDVAFEKRYDDPNHSYEKYDKPVDIKAYGSNEVAHSINYSNMNGKPYHGLDQPIKLIKPIKHDPVDIEGDDEDEEDDRLLVIAHRENGNHEEDESDHGSSDRADDSV